MLARSPELPRREKLRVVGLVLLSVVLLLVCRWFSGGLGGFLGDHGANLSFSFGAFFILRLARLPGGASGWVVAAYALVGVWGQELAQLLGLYRGTFDLRDLLFDAVGIGVALAVHAALPREGSDRGSG